MHDTGVSQLVVSVTKELPLAAKEVVGTLRELELMDLVFRDAAVLDRPVGDICSGAMPMIGIGEPVARVVESLERQPSVLVLEGGHPIGVLTRSDVLAFLAARALMSREQARARSRFRDPRHPRRPGRPTRPPARSSRRSASRRRSPRTRVGVHRGYEYARSGNPTRSALETCVASLEGAGNGLAFASGLAAEDALLRTLDPGDHVILPTDAYGGTFRLVARVHERFGIDWTAVDLDDLAARGRGLARRRRAWSGSRRRPTRRCRSSTSPASRELAHGRTPRVVVDNTFATPYLQQPLALGADAVVHSRRSTSAVTPTSSAGSSRCTTPSWPTSCASCRTRWARCPSPFDCYLVLRGVKTLGVRMDRHCENARAIVAAARASTTRSRGCCIPGCRAIPVTRSRRGR